jgi:hypothetical protein
MDEIPDSAESAPGDAGVATSARGADAAELAERKDVAKPDTKPMELPVWNPPALPEWQEIVDAMAQL